MNGFIHHMKDGSIQGVGFVSLRAFLDWAKTQKRVLIEMDGDAFVIRTM